MRKFADIVERVEIVRNKSGLNKSQFASAMGMKPQTYSNFVGAQASKPSIELIHGVVRQFRADPQWLLNGTGPMYLGERQLDGNSGAVASHSSSRAAKTASLPVSRMGHLELVREVITALEELQLLLARLQGNFSSMGRSDTNRGFN